MKYEVFTKHKMFFILWAAGMLHIVCILEPYLNCGTWQNWVTQNCTQGFVRPCKEYTHNLIGCSRDVLRNFSSCHFHLSMKVQPSLFGSVPLSHYSKLCSCINALNWIHSRPRWSLPRAVSQSLHKLHWKFLDRWWTSTAFPIEFTQPT